jgi:tetratricopeptide (TPR) repeat protein
LIRPKPLAESKRRIPLALLLALTIFAWLPSLITTSWTADDPEVLLQSPVITRALPASAAFDRDYTHHVGASGQWRPAAALSLRLDHWLYGAESSRGWHLTNLLLHLAAVTLAASLAHKLLGRLPILGLAFFAIHPLLTDSVAWASGRPSLLCVFLGLAGAHLLHRVAMSRQNGLVAIAAFVAISLPLLAKEDGALFAALLAVVAAKSPTKVRALTLAGVLIGAGAWLAARGHALGEAIPSAAEPLFAGAPIYERVFMGLGVVAESIRLLLLPFDRPPNYDRGSLPGVFASAAIIAAAAAALWFASKSKPLPKAAWGLPLLALAPFVHIIPIGEPFAPRFTHISLFYFIPLADDLLRRMAKPVPFAIFAVLTCATWNSTGHYRDAETYWLATLQHAPESPVALNALGLARAEDGRHEEAITSFKAAITHNASHSRAWSNLARSLMATGKEDEAVAALEAAVRSGPKNAIAHANWAMHLERQSDFQGAREFFLRAAQLRPGLPQAWAGIARTERHLGRKVEAEIAEQRARSLGTR